jgi:hypothetical protein
VTEADLYDGPTLGNPPENVVPLKPLFTGPAEELTRPIPTRPTDAGVAYQQHREVSPIPDLKKSYPAVLTAALDVLNARLLGLIAVIAACLIWGFAVWDPTQARTIAASLFSVTALLPLIVLYWKAGMSGTGG